MPCLAFMSCPVPRSCILYQKTGSREFGAPWIAPSSWDYSWCWHPATRSSTLPPAPREGLAAKAHFTFLWAPLKLLGVEMNDKVAVGVIKIQPWGRTHGKIISSISNKHRRDWLPGLFGKCFMVCLASCSGTTAFSGPSAGTIGLMSHMNEWILSLSILWKLCQESVTGICSCLQHSLTAGNRRSCQGLMWGGVCQKGAQEWIYLGSLCYWVLHLYSICFPSVMLSTVG